VAHEREARRAARHHPHAHAAQGSRTEPVENLWQVIRDNRLSNRIFRSCDDIRDHACAAWRRMVDQPWRIMTIGMRDWAHGL